jgi:hypothetical protein
LANLVSARRSRTPSTLWRPFFRFRPILAPVDKSHICQCWTRPALSEPKRPTQRGDTSLFSLVAGPWKRERVLWANWKEERLSLMAARGDLPKTRGFSYYDQC